MNKDTLRLVIDIHNFFFFREKWKRKKELNNGDPRIPIINHNRPTYATADLNFYFVTKDNEQVNDTVHCRDYLSDVFREALYGLGGSNWSTRHPPPELDELRIVMWSSQLNEKKVQTAVRVVNMYAKLAGWSETKAYLARIKSAKGKWLDAYLFVAPKEWQRCPQLLSLFILFIRIGKRTQVPDYIKDPYALECFWAEIVEQELNEGGDGIDDVRTFLNNCYEQLIVLMMNEKEIFDGDLKVAWPQQCEHRWGIYSLCLNKSTHPAAAKKLQKLYESEMKKHAGGRDEEGKEHNRH